MMKKKFYYFFIVIAVDSHPQPNQLQKLQKPSAVWADEMDDWNPSVGPPSTAVWADEIDVVDKSAGSDSHAHSAAPKSAVWVDEIESSELSARSDVINDDHISTSIIEKTPADRNYNLVSTDFDVEKLDNETRQLEAIAFPVGIAIGAIGAAIIPAIFPGSTTTTTTEKTLVSEFDAGTSNSDTSNNFVIVSGGLESTSTTEPATTTTFEPRTILEDFPNCGIKGSSNRVIGGTEVVENEYPWLCSLKYRGNHICGMTLISGPPHDTILVGAAHCYSPGDSTDKYTITCGEHSLQKQDTYQVTLQVTEVIIHPRYVEASSSGFDIAVYKVTEAPLNGKMVEKRLWPACLPAINHDYYAETTYVAGWGITQTKFIHGTKLQVKGIPDIARHTYVKVTNCKDDDNFLYPNGLICAADSGRDSCQGDSGGPLIGVAEKYSTRTDTRYSWIGIVSFGVGCAEPGYPGAYTRSSCFLGFIAEQFGLKADFTEPGAHPNWSTDCQNGSSRRSSAVRRHSTKNKRKNSSKRDKVKRKESKEDKNKKKDKKRNKSTNGGKLRSSNSTFIDKSQLITIQSLEKDEESVVENKKKNGKRKKHSRNNDASNGNKQDFLSILEQFVRPLLPM